MGKVIPTGPSLRPSAKWMLRVDDFAALPPELEGGARIRMVPRWPDNIPQAFVLNTHPPSGRSLSALTSPLRRGATSPSNLMDLQWVHESLALYLDAALRFCREKGRQPRNRRAKVGCVR